jgi:hypothetical protein
MTAPTHSFLHGWLAPLAALLAVPVAALFLCSCGAHDALPLLVWQGTTLGLLGLLRRLPRFRGRPAVPAGLVGVLAWMALAPVFFSEVDGLQGPVSIASSILVHAALGLAAGSLAARIAERDAVMRATDLPSAVSPGLGLAVALGAVLWLGAAAVSTEEPPPVATPEVLAQVELPALAATVRERIGPDLELHARALDTQQADGAGQLDVWLSASRDEPGTSAPVAVRSPGCLVDVPAHGRTIEVVSTATTLGVRWPTSPHGESYGGCTYDRATLRVAEDGPRRAAVEITWALGASPLFALALLLGGWRLRRQHARIARSPEVEVTGAGLATMPDGTPAIVPPSLPLGVRVVALRIADVRPDYRSDARTSIEELLVGQKAALLHEHARRVRAIELFALLGALFLASMAVATVFAGAVLGFA